MSKPMMGRGPSSNVKAKNTKKSIAMLLKYITRYLPLICLSLLATIASVVLTILAPSKVSNISTNAAALWQLPNLPLAPAIQEAMRAEIFKKINDTGIVLIIFYLTSFVLSYFQTFIMTGVNVKVTRRFREDISKKINNVPLSYFDRSSVGDILSRITNDVDTIGQSMNQAITSIVSATCMLIGVLIAMFITNWQMATAATLTVPVSMFFIIMIAATSQKFFRNVQIALGELNGTAEETYSGALVVKTFNAEKSKLNEFKESNQKLYQNAFKGNVLQRLMMPINTFVGNLGYVAICVVGGSLLIKGKIDIGDITAFIIYLNLFKSPMQQLAQAMSYVQQMAASSERVFEFLNLNEQEKEDYKTQTLEDIKGEITFEDVHFSYYPDKPIIKGFSAKVKPGSKVAIVGPTGAGKTTIVNLLMRFYEINSGRILIDGVDIKDLRREDVRKQFSMVLQDSWVFNGTIRENIVYSCKGVTDEVLDASCEAANIKSYIDQQENGYDTELSEKTTLSDGQRQLLTIARAMVQNSPMLILDEATSNVDTRTEILIQEAMDKLASGKTSFVIAHRLSTIKNADLILVLKDGNIIEQGNHDELMSLNGFYSNLYNSQFSNEAE